ncbi:RuvA C-terminal domain-containing protein [Hydrogenibacillus schlegelii]|uniref:RuvA C-terminal domain-containing protein n=1 Tax=Hydrogenibacillus schlegelii TaxID=1484 RepID=UPI0009E7EA7E|nr:RuvA C-terminal domain-containing protein [Hydrogenibacillus schlegelii]
MDALLVLGIPEGEARRAVEAVLQAGGEAGSTEALLRAALRQLDRTGRSPA